MDRLQKHGETTAKDGSAGEVELSGEGSHALVSNGVSPSTKQNTNQSAVSTNQEIASNGDGKSGGPKTQQGKERSKHNALKHGIFSQVVVLQGEPRVEFDSLLSGLQNSLEPKGALEELLVDKLVAIVWRHRRLTIAEGAEIRKGTEFLEWDEKQRQGDEPGRTAWDLQQDGLISKMANPYALDTCIRMLECLKLWLERDGSRELRDRMILRLVYGDSGNDTGVETKLVDLYSRCLSAVRSIGNASNDIDSPTPEECLQTFLNSLDEEMTRLKNYRSERHLNESIMVKVESRSGNVTDTHQLDRLLRYESNLERAFDRALNQLERLQRIRKGQPVLPTLDVNVTT
jgi:hypothetical protein